MYYFSQAGSSSRDVHKNTPYRALRSAAVRPLTYCVECGYLLACI